MCAYYLAPVPFRNHPRPAGDAAQRGADRHRNGLAHLRRGWFLEAVEELEAAAAALPDQHQVWTQLGVAQVGIGESRHARASFERSLSLQPEQAELWCNYGTILLHHDEPAPAVQALRQALTRQPRLLPARRNLALALYRLGRNAEAETLLPAGGDRFVLEGQARRENGDLEGATQCYRLSIQALETEGTPAPARPHPAFNTKHAVHALREAKDRLDRAGLPFFLLAGTLLGLVREGDLLPHDKDLDLAMDSSIDRGAVTRALCAEGVFTIPWFRGILPPERPWYRSLVHASTGCTLDIFFLKREEDRVLCGFDEQPTPVLSALRPFGLRTMAGWGTSWQVPDPPEAYFEQVYGPGWRVPDPDYDTVLTNPARCPESVPVVVCQAYLRVREYLMEGKRGRAASLSRQILDRRADPFLESRIPAWAGNDGGGR